MDEFREYLVEGISSLAKSLPKEMRSAAQFSSRPLVAPCRTTTSILDDQQPPQCTLLAFCVVGTLDTQVPNPDFTFTPFRLFRVQQQVNDVVADRDGFARELKEELFCTDVRSGSTTADSDVLSSTRSAINKFWPSRKQSTSAASRSSQDSTVEPGIVVLGDITVQKEVRVDVTQLNDNSVHDPLSAHDAVVAAGNAPAIPATYVDELYSLCYAPGIRLRPDSSLHVRRVSPA